MAGGIEACTLSRSLMKQLQPSNLEELKYILRDNFEGKYHSIHSIVT